MESRDFIDLHEAYLDIYEEERPIRDTEARRANQARAARELAIKAAKAGDEAERNRQMARYQAMSMPQSRREQLKLHKELGIHNEEVEIATEYFYEMGLNEYGVNALIEELGVEEFVEWVYDIAESYTLEEETRLQRMSGRKNKILTGPKGSRPQSTTKAREKKQGGVTMRTSSGPKSTMRKRAVRAAAETQPETREEPTKTKKGIAGAIEYAKKRTAADTELLRQGMRNLATSPAARGAATAAAALRAGGEFAYRAGQKAAETETGKNVKKTLGKAALAAAGAAGAGVGSLKVGKSPAAAARQAVGTFLRKMRAEDVEFVDWVENLWEDGYDLSDYTWEGLYEAYIEEGKADKMAHPEAREKARNERAGFYILRGSKATKARRKEHEGRRGMRGNIGGEGGSSQRYEDNIDKDYPSFRVRGKGFAESYDAYDEVLNYLLDEGYADTIESAETIIASMSEEWIVDILEAEKVFPLRKVADKTNELLRRINASKSPEEKAKLRRRMNKMNDEYWQPN